MLHAESRREPYGHLESCAIFELERSLVHSKLAMNLITGAPQAPTKPRDLAALVSVLKLRAAAGESQTELLGWL